MGAHINTSMKMSRRQMRLCQALKLVPVYPVTPQALDHVEDDDSGIDRTSPATIFFQNQSVAKEVVETTTNSTIEEPSVKAPISKTTEISGRKIKEEILEDEEESKVQVKKTVVKLDPERIEEIDSVIERLTPTSSTEINICQDINSEEYENEEEKETYNESESDKNELQTMFLSCGARQQGFNMDSLVNNKNDSFNEMRIRKLEIWDTEKLNAIFEIEQKLKELISIKGKVKRLKQSKKKLLKLKHKQEKIINRVKEDKLTEQYRSDETEPKYIPIIKTEFEENNCDLVEIQSPVSPVASSTAICSSSSSSSCTSSPSTYHQPYHKFKKFKLHTSSTPLKRTTSTKLEAFKTIDFKTMPCDKYDLLTIGPNGTKVAKAALQNINWSLSGAAVTRKILMEVFDRETLAFHTLTGKPSPAFLDCDKPMKGQLDPFKVADIIHIVTQNLKLTEKEVRQAITTKCADENKMFRQRERKLPRPGAGRITGAC